jgi:hypothetical protein
MSSKSIFFSQITKLFSDFKDEYELKIQILEREIDILKNREDCLSDKKIINTLNLKYDVLKDDHQNLVIFTKELNCKNDILLTRHNNFILYKAFKNVEYYILQKSMIYKGFNIDDYDNDISKISKYINLVKCIKNRKSLDKLNKYEIQFITDEVNYKLIKYFSIEKYIDDIEKILKFNNNTDNDKKSYYYISIFELENASQQMASVYDNIDIITYKYCDVFNYFEKK